MPFVAEQLVLYESVLTTGGPRTSRGSPWIWPTDGCLTAPFKLLDVSDVAACSSAGSTAIGLAGAAPGLGSFGGGGRAGTGGPARLAGTGHRHAKIDSLNGWRADSVVLDVRPRWLR